MEQKNKGSCITFGCEAGGRPNRRERRGARRRRNKVLRGVRHHVRYVAGALGPKDVVLDDERTRACGRRSTTSGTPAAPWAPKTWCLTTKEQGFAGSGAPRHRGGAPPGGSSKKDRRTVGPPNPSTSPTSPSGFSWSSSWIAAFSGFWHVPARYGRSAAGPWSRTGSNNSCC